jgi:hypothetical protein
VSSIAKEGGLGHIGRSFRLTNEPGGLGLTCTESGLSLAGVPLLRKSATGFAPRPAAEIETLIQAAYDERVRAIDLLPGIDAVARALSRGDVSHAMIAAVLTRMPELDWIAAARLAHAEEQLAKYSPDEPRDWRGRWTAADGDDASQNEAAAATNEFSSNGELVDQGAQFTPASFVTSQDEPDEDDPAPPDDRPPLERKYDDLGPVEFAKQVIQFGWNLGVDGKNFTPEQWQDALAEYNFLQDRLNFWLAYDNKPPTAEANLLSAALNLYTGAVNGKIVPVGGKGGDLPASMLAVATGILAADNGTPSVRLRGPAGGAEVEPEPVPLEHEPIPAEDESIPSRGPLAAEESGHIIDELTRTGELGEVISSDEAKIDWDSGTDKGLQWEDYNEAKYPEITRLRIGTKASDFFDDVSGEAISDKAIDPLCYTYINHPNKFYSKIKGYIDNAAKYSRPRTRFDLKPEDINSRSLRLGVRNYISDAQWESLYRVVIYARRRGIKIIITRFN